MTSQLLVDFHQFYVKYKEAWSRNNLEQMQQMISPSLQAREITDKLEVLDFGYEASVEGWKQGFDYFADQDMEWIFKDVAVIPLRENEVTAIFWVWYRMDGIESKIAHFYVETFQRDPLSHAWTAVRSYIEASVPRDRGGRESLVN